MADTRPFTVTESFYSDSQYYILAPGPPGESKVDEKAASQPVKEVDTQEEEEPRFVVESQITPEMKEELTRELAEIALAPHV